MLLDCDLNQLEQFLVSFAWKHASTTHWAYFIRLAEGFAKIFCCTRNLSSCYLQSAYSRDREPFWLREPQSLHIFSYISVRAIWHFSTLNASKFLTNVCIFKQNHQFLTMVNTEISSITCFLLLMRLLVLHSVADNTKLTAGRAGGPCFHLKIMNFRQAGRLYKRAGRRSAKQGGPVGCTSTWARPFLQPSGPPCCAARWKFMF